MTHQADHVHPYAPSIPPLVAVQPGIAADRFAREITGFLKALPALAAAECQPFDGMHSPARS